MNTGRIDRAATMARLPDKASLKKLSSAELSELPDTTFQLVDSYLGERERLEPVPVQKGEVMLMVPARNEQGHIAETLESLRRNGHDCDVIVSLNNVSDNTRQVVLDYARQRPDVEAHVVTQEDRLPAARQRDGSAQRIFLWDSSEPGKLGAMIRPQAGLEGSGVLPQYILSLDADTELGRGHIDYMRDRMETEGLSALAGKFTFEVPEGYQLAPHNLATNRTQGLPGYQWLNGAYALYETKDFFAGHRAIHEVIPGMRTEDSAFGNLLGACGSTTRVDPNINVPSMGAVGHDQAKAQWGRWLGGGLQQNKLFGQKVLALNGCGGHQNKAAEMATMARAIFRQEPIGAAFVQTLCLPLQMANFAKLSAEVWHDVQDLPLDKPAHWMPQRT
ncbi:MAG: glycosyltransferase family 2 protein [Vulcanimicrobiota bacterium]